MKRLLIILSLLPVFVNATNYYFKSTGSDAATGLSDAQAWQTITKFNSFFASLSPGDSVLFKRGDTFAGGLIISRSGSSGSPIIIGAYGSGAKPIFSGFTTVSAWTSLGSGIYESTSAVTAETYVNLVTFQDTMQPMGRWPKLSAANKGYLSLQSHSGNTSLTSNAIGSALSYVGGEVVYRPIDWVLDRGRITAQTSTTVTYNKIKLPAGFFVYEPVNGGGFFFQNHVNACTVLGEWAYDSTTKKIKMYFGGASPSSYTIKVAAKNTMINVGSNSYIRFHNIKVIGANENGFLMNNCNNIQWLACDIDFMGNGGIENIAFGSNTFLVNGCTFNHINNNGIFGNYSAGWTIQSNDFQNCGMIRGMGPSGAAACEGICLVDENSLIEYNVIKRMGYNGIDYRGDNIIIRYNFIDSICMILQDGAGIYTYGSSGETNRQIYNNIVLHSIGDYAGKPAGSGPNAHGIYADAGATDITITNNSIAYTSFSGIHMNWPKRCTLLNNTIYNTGDKGQNNSASFYINNEDAINNMVIKQNIAFQKDSSQLIWVIYNDGNNAFPTWGVIDSNFYCRPIWEPQGIAVTGFSGAPPDNDGGITYHNGAGADLWRSLDTWQTFVSPEDANTVNTPMTITDVNDLRFEYNATNSAVVIPLPFNYIDARGVNYNGTITLQPYTSAVLIKNGDISGNQSPTANAGTDISITLPTNSTTLSGSGDDQDGTITTYAWTKISGPATYTIASPSSASTGLSNLVQGTYVFKLTVTDNDAATDTDEVTVTVNAAVVQTKYYVSNSGSDAAAGTLAAPWLTIAKVNSSTFNAGDTIFFNKGNQWREQLTLPSSGAVNNRIVFTAYGSGAKPIINAADIETGWTSAGSNQWYINNPNAVTTRAMVIIDNVIYAEQTSLAAVNSANEYFIDLSTSPDRVYVYSTDDPDLHTVEVSNREYCIITAAGASSKRYISINNIEVRYAGRAGIYFEGPGDDPSDALDGNSEVKNCFAYANRIFGMVHYDHYDNVLFEDCKATYNGSGFYSWVAKDGTFRRDTSSNSIQYTVTFTDGHAVGGFQSDNWLVEYCYSDQDHDAIHIAYSGASADAIIRYNKVFNSKTGSPPTQGIGTGGPASGDTVQIYYNLMVNCASAGFETYGTNSGTVWIYNNTIYNNTATAEFGSIYLGTNGTNFVLKNNLIVRDYVASEYTFVNVGATMSTNNYNNYYILNNVSGTLRNSYNGSAHTTMAAWRTATSQDANSISADPLFVNVASNWSLQSGSPAINTGVSVGLTQDILGNPIVGNPDIGAYETATGNQSPTANAGSDISITLPTNSTTLAGSGDDPDGTISTYLWSKISGPATFTIANANAASTGLSNLVEGVYVFRLTVTDNNGATDTDDVTVTVNAAANQAPTANAGNDIVITLPTSSTTLSGSGNDPDGTITTYAWAKFSGPATYTIANASSASTGISNLIQGVYVFRLTVTDDDSATDTDDVTVTVNAAAGITQYFLHRGRIIWKNH